LLWSPWLSTPSPVQSSLVPALLHSRDLERVGAARGQPCSSSSRSTPPSTVFYHAGRSTPGQSPTALPRSTEPSSRSYPHPSWSRSNEPVAESNLFASPSRQRDILSPRRASPTMLLGRTPPHHSETGTTPYRRPITPHRHPAGLNFSPSRILHNETNPLLRRKRTPDPPTRWLHSNSSQRVTPQCGCILTLTHPRIVVKKAAQNGSRNVSGRGCIWQEQMSSSTAFL